MFNLKFYFNSLFLVFVLITSACTSQQKISRDFDPKSKIQTIEVFPKYYVYAQEDKILNSTLEKELSKMNADWAKEVSSYKTYQNLHFATALLQFGSLLACIMSLGDNNDNEVNHEAMGWCSASIGFGLISIPLERAGRLKKHKVISSYNSKY